jgi:hypothetical protein
MRRLWVRSAAVSTLLLAASRLSHCAAAPPPPPPAAPPPLPRTLAELDEAHERGALPAAAALAAAEALLERSDAPQAHWRLARALHQLATAPPPAPQLPAAQRLALLQRAHAALAAAKAELPRGATAELCAAHRWSGIVLSDLSALQGTREAILAAYAVRSDFEQALALDPGDASAHHLLGAWALRVALLGPWTRWLAGTLYAEPPSATLAEAVEAFEAAEALQPGFWVANRAQLARALAAQGDAGGARRWAEAALELPARTADDAAAHEAARAVLAGLPAAR